MLDDGTFSGISPIPRGHGRRLRTGDATRRIDYCRVWLSRHTVRRHGERQRVGRRLIVSIPLSQKGAVFLDEEGKVYSLFGVEALAGAVKERQKLDGLPTYAQLVAEFPKIETNVVALAAPGDAPGWHRRLLQRRPRARRGGDRLRLRPPPVRRVQRRRRLEHERRAVPVRRACLAHPGRGRGRDLTLQLSPLIARSRSLWGSPAPAGRRVPTAALDEKR